MSSLLVVIAAFICISTLVAAVALGFKPVESTGAEKRLEGFAHNTLGPDLAEKHQPGILAEPLETVADRQNGRLERFPNLQSYIEQSGLKMSSQRMISVIAGFGFLGGLVGGCLQPFQFWVPVLIASMAGIPTGYVWFCRRRRLKTFSAQLPDTLELVSRALRAGHSLPSGIQLVAEQMPSPIGPEFGRCFEEQKLGVPLEESLKQMTQRIPNVDLRFFATAVILQRATGGNLSEILEKLGRLIRERFRVFGQIQALTGEGRLSGIVLLLLPPVLFLAMLRLNYDYVMMLFEDPLGKQMLA
ncbi:MAG: type II secretion system F family protein, partial [Planctomycetota bacterium]|nr:type II secretion system F family protein [Planctomycetota bacterium]